MQLDHRNYEETIEAELLEFTGEVDLHEPMQFARVQTTDGRLMEVMVESTMSPFPSESFRAIAHASPFKPDHSSRDPLSNEPSLPWIENVEIFPRRRDAAWRLVGKRVIGDQTVIDDIEATDIISYLDLRGVSNAVARRGGIRIKAGEGSVFHVSFGSISHAGDHTNDARVIRAMLDYAKTNWGGQCVVKGSPKFMALAWAQSQLIGITTPNYQLPLDQAERAERLISEARVSYMWMTQVPSSSLAARNLLRRSSQPPREP